MRFKDYAVAESPAIDQAYEMSNGFDARRLDRQCLPKCLMRASGVLEIHNGSVSLLVIDELMRRIDGHGANTGNDRSEGKIFESRPSSWCHHGARVMADRTRTRTGAAV